MREHIEVVIKMSRDQYSLIMQSHRGGVARFIDKEAMIYAIKNGTRLPKGHGRIVDENKITKCEQIGLVMKNGNVTRCLITDAPTIIEADKV